MRLLLLAAALALHAQTVEELAQRAGSAMAQRDYSEAESAYRLLLKQRPAIAEAHSNLGIACYFQEKFSEAEQAFMQALKLQPDLFTPAFLLGQIRFRQERYREALPLLERARRLKAEPEVSRVLAATLAGLKQHERALEVSRELLKIDPRDTEALYALGRIYLAMAETAVEKLKPYKEDGFAALLVAEHNAGYEQWRSLALNSYKDAIDAKLAIPGLRTGYAKLLIAGGDWAAAREVLEEELRRDPESYEARFQLARVALAAGAVAETQKLIEEAANIRPEFFEPLPDLKAPEAVPESKEHPFASALLAGDSSRARDALDGIAQRVKASEAKTVAPAARESAGLALLGKKRYEEGLRILSLLPGRKPAKPSGQALAAHALYKLGRYDHLAAIYGGAATPEALYWLAQAYRQLAVRNLQTVAALDPESPRSRQMLGDAYLAEGRYQEAATEYDGALKREPGNAEVWYSLGAAYFRQMQYPLAVQAFDRVIEIDSLHAEAHLMRGDALVQMNESDKARPSLERSLELNAKLLQAHVLLGKVYGNAGDMEKARLHLEKGAPSDTDGSVHYQLFRIYRRLNLEPLAAQALKRSQELRGKPGRGASGEPGPGQQ